MHIAGTLNQEIAPIWQLLVGSLRRSTPDPERNFLGSRLICEDGLDVQGGPPGGEGWVPYDADLYHSHPPAAPLPDYRLYRASM